MAILRPHPIRALIATALMSAALLGLGACQPRTASVTTPIDLGRETDAIRGLEADRRYAMNDRELDDSAKHYATAALVAWPGMTPIRGRPDIRAALAATFKDPAFKVDFHADRIKVSKEGDLAWASGDYTLTRTDPATGKPVTLKGPFVETFAKGPDDTWVVTSGVSGQVTAPPPQ